MIRQRDFPRYICPINLLYSNFHDNCDLEFPGEWYWDPIIHETVDSDDNGKKRITILDGSDTTMSIFIFRKDIMFSPRPLKSLISRENIGHRTESESSIPEAFGQCSTLRGERPRCGQ